MCQSCYFHTHSLQSSTSLHPSHEHAQVSAGEHPTSDHVFLSKALHKTVLLQTHPELPNLNYLHKSSPNRLPASDIHVRAGTWPFPVGCCSPLCPSSPPEKSYNPLSVLQQRRRDPRGMLHSLVVQNLVLIGFQGQERRIVIGENLMYRTFLFRLHSQQTEMSLISWRNCCPQDVKEMDSDLSALCYMRIALERGQSHLLLKGKDDHSSTWTRRQEAAPEDADALHRILYNTQDTMLFAIEVPLGSQSLPSTVSCQSQVQILL